LGRDENGKAKYKDIYGRTQKEADEKALQVKAAMRKGLDVTAERDTFGTWAERWLKVKAGEVSAGRLVTYESNVKHLARYLEHAQISKIRTSDIQTIILDLAELNPNTGKPTAKKTLAGVKSTAVQILQLAVDNRVMDYNPANAVKIPNILQETTRRALTEGEQHWITDTPHRAKRAAMIMMYAGLRRGELIPLLWGDIDLAARTISVNKTVEKVEGQFSLKNTAKSKAGIRVVDIPQKLADFLEGEPHESIYVCVTAKGKMHTESSWRRMWDSYLADINLKYGSFSPFEKKPKSKFAPVGVPFVIPPISPHWLRHTFATMLYLAGVDILTAKEQLGHADIKTTLEIYTHLDAIYKRKAMNKLDDFLAVGVK
jgi:integrase